MKRRLSSRKRCSCTKNSNTQPTAMPTSTLLLLFSLHYHMNLPMTTSTQSSPHPYRLTLPDSTQSPPITLIGSPAYSQSVDSRGYTVLVDPKDGYVKYATVDSRGIVVPSKYKMLVNETLDPGELYGLSKYVGPSVEAKAEACGSYCSEEWEAYEWKESGENGGCELFCLDGGILRRLRDGVVEKVIGSSSSSSRYRWLSSFLGGKDDDDAHTVQQRLQSSKSFTESDKGSSNNDKSNKSKPRNLNKNKPLPTQNNKLLNLVIPIKFANHASRPSISKYNLDTLFNSPDPIPGLTPTGSIRSYFSTNSYGKVILESTIVDWIRVKNTEQYYAGKKSGISSTFHQSLIEALDKLDSDPSFNLEDYDTDGDKVVDSVFFLHSGYGAEWGGVDCINGNDASNRIWSHKWKIGGGGWVSKRSGVRVEDYGVGSAFWGVCGKEVARIGVIAHEMGRLFGLPSLYGGDAPYGGNGIGSFGLMGNSWGWDGSQYYLPLMSPWSKMELGWLDPVTITSSGAYSLPPVDNNPKAFRIDLGRDDEFLLLENRAATSYDSNIPKSGLIIWHIDNRAPHYPSVNLIHSDSLGSHAHYRVALVAADGAFDLEGGLNRGDEGDIFGSNHSIGVGFTGEDTSYPNTDMYRDGVATPSGIQITSISDPEDDPNEHIQFTVLLPGDPLTKTTDPSTKPTPSNNSQKNTVQNSVLSTFAANTGSTGIMFDVVAINDVDIVAFDLHLRSDAVEGEKMIEIYTMSGSHIRNDTGPEQWGKVCCSKGVMGNGVSKRTTLDSTYFFRKISVASGERIAFYVTSDEAIIRYTTSSKPECCEISAVSLDLQIYEGSGVGSYPFGPTAKPRIFNGAIHYEVGFKAPSTKEPSVDYPPDSVKTATSSFFNGNTGGYGIMFDVIPNRKLVVLGLDFHTDLEDNLEVNVWIRRGSHQGYERDQLSWEHVCDRVQLKGQGPYKPTSITKDFRHFEVDSFERTAFYVTLSTPNMRYTKLDESVLSVGDSVYDLSDLRILAGSGIKGFPFGSPTSPCLWNGSIRYAIVDEETTVSSQAAPKSSFNSNFTAEAHSLSTTFASGNKGFGSMFDVSNTEGEYAVITGIDFHTNLQNDDVNVVVYTKEGSYLGSEFTPGDWHVIANTSVVGQGYYKRTPIPIEQQVSVVNGGTRAFYVSIDKPNLLYSNADDDISLGDTVYQQNGMQFRIGSGLQGTFSDVFQPRIYNGGIQFYQYTSSKEYTSEEDMSQIEGESQKYETPLGGDSSSFGIMFSIRNKHSSPIFITSFAFHTNIEEDSAVEVYTTSGGYTGKERISDEWTQVSRTIVQAQGLNKWSQVPSLKMQPVSIVAGASQSFYLTLEQPNLKYLLHGDMDSELMSYGNKFIEISAGVAVLGYPFGSNASPRKPVIQVEYKIAPNT